MNAIWVIAATVNLVCSSNGCIGTTANWSGNPQYVETGIPKGWSAAPAKACRIGPGCEQPRGPDAISIDEGPLEILMAAPSAQGEKP